jgi:hypothetical protein
LALHLFQTPAIHYSKRADIRGVSCTSVAVGSHLLGVTYREGPSRERRANHPVPINYTVKVCHGLFSSEESIGHCVPRVKWKNARGRKYFLPPPSGAILPA